MKTHKRDSEMKKKFVRANEAPYITKTLRKPIMKMSELKGKYKNKQDMNNFRKENTSFR